MDNDKLYIEDFAYYLNGRNTGHIKVICPLCHDQRSNKKDKSLSIDCATLAYKCHYCGASGYLKSRTQESIQRINREVKHMPKTYRKPSTQPNIQTTLDAGVVAYFKGRGISEKTLLEAKVTKETYYFPQDSAKRGCIAFNYYVDGEHVNTKYRTRDKHFTFIGGAKVVPYNLDSIAENTYSDGEQKYCIITEGECFDEDAHVLTQSGCWKKIKDLKQNDEVAQWENGIITFAKPLAIVRKQYEGNMVELYSHRGNYTSFTTPLHNLVVERNGIIKKCHAIDIHSQINIPRNGIYNGVGIPLSEERLRLLIAISADFTIREKGDLYACFKKERKIERIKMLLEQNNLRYTAYNSSRDGYVDFYVHRHQIQAYKEFPNEWLYLASKEQIRVMLEELVLWDGNSVNNRTMKEYNTKLYHNAVWVQTLCHLGGMMSTITYRENEHGKWYKVSLLEKSFSSISSKRKRLVPYKGMVYCCTMPKGTLLVRQNENITVSGNCDTLTYIECGYKHVISMPAGANVNLEWMDDYVESHFDKLKIIYVSTDGDKKGIEAKNELIRRFGAEMCKVVEYPDGCKDINEVLVKYGREKVVECFENAYDVKPQGIEELYDVQTDLDYLFHNGLQKGATINIPDVDNILSFKTGMLTVVTGIPSHGKTYLLNYFLTRLNVLNDWKIAFFSPEFYPVTLHISQIIETLGGARFNAQNYNQRTYEVLKEYVNNNFFWIDPDDTDINSVLERGKYLIRKKGIRAFVIDPFNALTDKERTTQKQDEYISEFLQKIRWFARKYDVALFLVMHPTKQQKLESGLYPVVDLYACKGASEIYDKADIGITVWRNEQANYAEMHVTKMKFRHLGEKGRATFVFNINNGRYVSIPNIDGKAVYINPNEIPWDNSNYVINKIENAQEQQSISFTNDTTINVQQEELDPLGLPIAGEAPF